MDRDRFIAEVKVQQNALRSFLLALCGGDKAEADDIAQETFVKAYLAIDRYRDSGQFRAWLFKIAHNTFLSNVSGQRGHDPLERVSAVPANERSDSGFEHQELYMALSALPPKERSAITLFYLSGHSIKEIAAITDTSEDAVKKQLSRGREKLKDIIRR